MEWLFAATMPSFMDALGPGERLRIPLLAPLLVAAPAALLAWTFGWIVPALVLACAAILLVDNFTYTVFRFGIATTAGWWRAAYVVLWVVLVAAMYRALGRARWVQRPAVVRAAGALLLAAALGSAWRWAHTAPEVDRGGDAVASRRPNILIISTDGLDAARMSAYGYRRDTTPFVRTLMRHALVAENALPNGTITVASLVSMLTGKLPIRTRVYSTKDALLGPAAYQSLPAILRRTGYTTIALVPGVVDPFAQNLRDAFDVANARKLRDAVILPSLPDGVALALAPEVYFLQHTWDRLEARVAHATGLRPMTNALREVTTPQEFSDTRRIRTLIDFVAHATRPVFALVHLMGTHGPYAARHRRWSRDPADRNGPYDDAIREYDRHVTRVVRALARQGKLDDTIVVVLSDHGSVRRIARVPFVVRFPQDEHQGRITENVQLLDLAPTLLDHLGLPVPGWMDGQSLLAHRPDRRRPILTVDVFRGAPGGERLTSVTATVCDRSYELDFFHGALNVGKIEGHLGNCGQEGVVDTQEAGLLITGPLRANGLDPKVLTAQARELDMVGANLAGALFAGARLAGRFMNGANFRGATFANADMVGATLANADLTDANLTGADLRNGRLHQANLTRAKLAGANLSEARLPSVRAPEADLDYAKLQRASLIGIDLRGATLVGADLTGANLTKAILAHARLRGAKLQGANLVDADLSGADLQDADLHGANLKGATLTEANLSGAKMPVSP
jgi:uncharacterized protein YjbI with pentapeptide repeats